MPDAISSPSARADDEAHDGIGEARTVDHLERTRLKPYFCTQRSSPSG